jgi:predicted component of type VI protein secretion system
MKHPNLRNLTDEMKASIVKDIERLLNGENLDNEYQPAYLKLIKRVADDWVNDNEEKGKRMRMLETLEGWKEFCESEDD